MCTLSLPYSFAHFQPGKSVLLSSLCWPAQVWRVAQAFGGSPCLLTLACKIYVQLLGLPAAYGLACGKPYDCQALLRRLTALALLVL